MPQYDPIAARQFERAVKRLHDLGPRALGEFLTEIMMIAPAQADRVNALLQDFGGLSPTLFRCVGGDRFPTRRPLAVPR